LETNAHGYLLLLEGTVDGYRGVDRRPFQPELLENEMTHSPASTDLHRISDFYPPGWRRKAYRLYEEDAVLRDGDIMLLSTLETAIELQELLRQYAKERYEIVEVTIFELKNDLASMSTSRAGFLGYDIAYPGGDFYSALLNGLLLNAHPELFRRYSSELNEFRLFRDLTIALEYLSEFLQLVETERASEFHVFALFEPAAHEDGAFDPRAPTVGEDVSSYSAD
jgi:hypothetical protein